MTMISEMIEMVRAATGPSRAIDLHLHASIAQAGQWADSDIQYALSDIEGTTAPPAYTGSLDSITALIEQKLPGRYVAMNTGGETMPQAIIAATWLGQARTLPLALCLAFLLAKQSQDTDHE